MTAIFGGHVLTKQYKNRSGPQYFPAATEAAARNRARRRSSNQGRASNQTTKASASREKIRKDKGPWGG